MIKKISEQNFKKYGCLIGYPRRPKRPRKNLFRVLLREPQRFGWRIAYLVVREKAIKRLEQHLHTYESFEPVKGRALLYLSLTKDQCRIECFLLDRPVVLSKGVWHGVVTLDRESEIKITENARVRSIYWNTGMILDGKGIPPK
jgi:ureidoglycolate hydrolase